MFDSAGTFATLADSSIRWCVETLTLALLMSIVAAVAGRSRRLGPAARHALWLVVLLKLVTPPLVDWPWSAPWSSRPVATVDSPRLVVDASEESPADAEAALEVADAAFESAIRETALAPTDGTAPANAPKPRDWAPVLAVSKRVGVASWALGSILMAMTQGRRLLRFRRHSRQERPAPGWLVEEAEEIGRRLSVRVPPIRLVGGLTSPSLWCLGRTVLLVPSKLVDSLGAERWRGILSHEFAHIRRGDPWVCRLEFLAALIWWWNPLFFWVRSRLDAEAELACDAWVVATFPDDRFTYVESLIMVCSALPKARTPAPSLGVASTGRFFERRLTMILGDRISCRLSLPGLMAATLMALLAVPSWTKATPAPAPESKPALSAGSALVADDEGDDQDEDKPAAKPAREKDKKAARQEKKKAKRAEKSKGGADSDAEKVVEKALGPDFEKKMEALGEKIGKEMEAKFGPGSDFEKKMEAFGKEMEAKFGPGSEFAEEMEKLGKEMEAKFGPGSDFAEEMKSLGVKVAKKAEAKAKATKDRLEVKKGKPSASRAARAKELEARIRELKKELEKLQAEGDEDEGDDEDGGDEDED